MLDIAEYFFVERNKVVGKHTAAFSKCTTHAIIFWDESPERTSQRESLGKDVYREVKTVGSWQLKYEE